METVEVLYQVFKLIWPIALLVFATLFYMLISTLGDVNKVNERED